MRKHILLYCGLYILMFATTVFAAPTKVYIAEVNVVGVSNKDEMKTIVQTLLSSRLNNNTVVYAGAANEADFIITGTYISVGKVFSIDALLKNTAGKTVTRAFVQGENQDELIPAIGKLADKVTLELGKLSSGATTPAASGISNSPAAVATKSSDIISTTQQIQPAPAGDFIKPVNQDSNSSAVQSKRIDGAANLMALGATLPDGSRQLFLAEDRRLTYYRKTNDVKLVASVDFKASEKIISLDTLEDTNGNTDLFVTIIRSNELQSQVFQVKNEKLVCVAENLPYYFRTLSLAGETKKLYVQGMGRTDDFYGAVSEARRSGTTISLLKSIKLPRFGTLYTFNQFRNSDGKTLTVTYNPDGYLVVYDQELKELWRSNDKFGGSELYFQKDDADVRTTGDINRWIFMNQRILVTPKNEVIVGKNDGFWVLGNARTYKKGTIHNLAWNGSSLEEKWHTRETQNYMPDFLLDESRNELIQLLTVQRPGFMSKGASSLSIKRIE